MGFSACNTGPAIDALVGWLRVGLGPLGAVVEVAPLGAGGVEVAVSDDAAGVWASLRLEGGEVDLQVCSLDNIGTGSSRRLERVVAVEEAVVESLTLWQAETTITESYDAMPEFLRRRAVTSGPTSR